MSGKGVLSARRPATAAKGAAPSGGLSSLFRIYTDDTPGIKVGPTTVLVLSLLYMALVVSLHILSKLKAVALGSAAPKTEDR